MTNAEKAKRIVDHVLAWVDKAGRFEGRGKDRTLMLSPLVLNMRTGKSQGVMERIVEDVAAMLGDRRC